MLDRAAYKVAFHGASCRIIFLHGEPGRGWLWVCVEVVFPSLGWSPLFPVRFLFFQSSGLRTLVSSGTADVANGREAQQHPHQTERM